MRDDLECASAALILRLPQPGTAAETSTDRHSQLGRDITGRDTETQKEVDDKRDCIVFLVISFTDRSAG